MIKTIEDKYKEFVLYTQIYSLNITLMAAVFLIMIFLGATSFLYMLSP
jgi:hypothetical protein